jgi:hypothetical protein
MNFPNQTDSQYPSIRAWGCLMMVYAWFVSVLFKVSITIQEIEGLWKGAIEDGIILNNDLPTDGSQGKWYRCFMHKPEEWIEFVAAYLEKKVEADLVYIAPRHFETTDFYVVESSAFLSKPIKAHFTGEMLKGESYNPDPRIKLLRTLSVRGWNIKEVIC